MSNFVRRLVSGNKARFKDENLKLELDLVYVTDHIIIMGFPATGVEGMYRNHREDAKKFLDHRHGKNYWVFNFCPLRENSYPASFFEGRVSRYPFPDHHAPPLAILPLFAREAREWLNGSKERVAVLHCKAGKGRSGTLACAYLLAADESPAPPRLQRSLTKKELAGERADQVMEKVETMDMEDEDIASESKKQALKEVNDADGTQESTTSTIVADAPLASTPPSEVSSAVPAEKPSTEAHRHTLEDVLALHTARRMKAPSDPSKKLKQGVSIPSQRRFLHYWSLLLAGVGPSGLWAKAPSPPLPYVRLLEVRVRLREFRGVKKGLIRVANELLERKASGKGKNKPKNSSSPGGTPVWLSLSRYDDSLVEHLQKWEQYTRSEDGHLGRRRRGSDMMNGEALQDIFKDGKWDNVKMIKSFARLGCSGNSTPSKEQSDAGNILSYTLRPLTDQKLEVLNEFIKDSVSQEPSPSGPNGSGSSTVPGTSANSSVIDLAPTTNDNEVPSLLVDAGREVRGKIYLGRVFLGWFWFVPSFHMPPPPSNRTEGKSRQPTHITLTRKEIDFAVGAGAALIDIDLSLEWAIQPPRNESVPPSSNPNLSQDTGVQADNDSKTLLGPPRLQESGESLDEPAADDSALAMAVQVAISDGASGEVAEALDAAKES